MTIQGAGGFDLLDLSNLSEVREQARPMLVEGLIPMGEPGMLVGEPATSKTEVALSVAISIALGRSIWGLSVSDARPVVFLALEGSKRSFHDRIRRIVDHMDPVFDSDCHDLLSQNLQILFPSLETASPSTDLASKICSVIDLKFEERGQGGLLIVDTLANLIEGEENAAESARAPWMMANLLGNQFGWTTIFVHHLRKTYQNTGRSNHSATVANIRGSSAHGASARFILQMSRLKPAASGWSPYSGTPLQLQVTKDNEGPEGFQVNLTRDAESGILSQVLPPSDQIEDTSRTNRDINDSSWAATKEGRLLAVINDAERNGEELDHQAIARTLFPGSKDPDASLRSCFRRLRSKGYPSPGSPMG